MGDDEEVEYKAEYLDVAEDAEPEVLQTHYLRSALLVDIIVYGGHG